jgi:hypothetical protein
VFKIKRDIPKGSAHTLLDQFIDEKEAFCAIKTVDSSVPLSL